MMKCAIFTGGVIENYSAFSQTDFKDFAIICADAGYLHAKMLGLAVDVAVGDFDTLKAVPDDVDEVLRYEKDKDDTDTMLAVKLALKKGYRHIDIYGALGNRFDHTFANIQVLDFILENNATGRILAENDEISIIKNTSIKIPRRNGYALSVFAFSNLCEGVSITGVKFPAENIEISQSFPIGISNIVTSDFAEIDVKKGKLLIIISKIQSQQ